ncbi:MAG TPA: PstS family phosphate ABC transporter substrate-binding protein [Longimicrobiales bacterium]
MIDAIKRARPWLVGAMAAMAAVACGERGPRAGGGLAGSVEVDGSSTVYPITEAVAEEFTIETGGDVRVTVGVSGTGGGFKRFCAGETAVSNASRPIKASERAACEQAGIEYVELPVAYDGIAVVVNPASTFVQCLTTQELRRLWAPASTVRRWSDIRPAWPAAEIRLYGPGTDSGTFDYFTAEVVGEEGASRADYTASENDNVLVQGVTGDPNALGYFGFAYYEENTGRLRLLGVDGGAGCVRPTRESIKSGEYPLSRPIFIYVNTAALQRPAVAAFVRFYLETAGTLAPEVGYIALEPSAYQDGLRRVAQAAAGAPDAASDTGAAGAAGTRG